MSTVLAVQGWFYVITGLWPVLHIKSFEMITGSKKEKWLVKTVGLFVLTSGIIFIKYNDTEPALLLAILNAFMLAMVDIYYHFKGILPKVYLLDAAVELGFIVVYMSLLD